MWSDSSRSSRLPTIITLSMSFAMAALWRKRSRERVNWVRKELLGILSSYWRRLRYWSSSTSCIGISSLAIYCSIMGLSSWRILASASRWRMPGICRRLCLGHRFIWRRKCSKERRIPWRLIFGHLVLYCMRCCLGSAHLKRRLSQDWSHWSIRLQLSSQLMSRYRGNVRN